MRVVTLGERPDLRPALERIAAAVWPPSMAYIRQDAVCNRYWPALSRDFADFQPVLCDGRGRVVAGGYTVPFAWDARPATLPSGVDGVLVQAMRDHRLGRPPTTLSALLAVVDPRRQGRGLSAAVIRAMATLARRHGLRALVAPVRPTLKHRYPLTPMVDYIRVAPRRPDPARSVVAGACTAGRAHPASRATIDGDRGPRAGVGGLDRPAVSAERSLRRTRRPRARHDRSPARPGRYVEPNVWMLHPV